MLALCATGNAASAFAGSTRSPLAATQTFASGFQFATLAQVPDAACSGGQAIQLTGSFIRAGRPPWAMYSRTCIDGTDGVFTVTSGSGIVLSGGTTAESRGERTTMVLTVTHATRRYSGGRFDLSFSIGAGPSPTVTGTLILLGPAQRSFDGVATVTKLQPGSSVHCGPGKTFVDAAGTLARTGGQAWQFQLQTCTPTSSFPIGTFTLTSPSGTVITGSPDVRLVGTVLTMTLYVREASREYLGGNLTITIDTAHANKTGTVRGTLTVV